MVAFSNQICKYWIFCCKRGRRSGNFKFWAGKGFKIEILGPLSCKIVTQYLVVNCSVHCKLQKNCKILEFHSDLKVRMYVVLNVRILKIFFAFFRSVQNIGRPGRRMQATRVTKQFQNDQCCQEALRKLCQSGSFLSQAANILQTEDG